MGLEAAQRVQKIRQTVYAFMISDNRQLMAAVNPRLFKARLSILYGDVMPADPAVGQENNTGKLFECIREQKVVV